MATKTTEFDAAKHLISPGSQAELLSDALESGDASYIANAIEVIARARGAGVTSEALYKTLGTDGDPKMTTFLEVVKSFGFMLSAQVVR